MFKETLASLPLFRGLDPQDLSLLSERLQTDSFSDDEIIFGQGDRADRLYVLISGKVAIQFKPEDGDTITVTEIKEGGVFGWSSALGRQTYTSCAVCLEESEALSMVGDELRELCATHPETGIIILERLAEVIASRLRNAHAHVVEMLQQGMQTTIES
jgi:CRP-like cAMP-binding protein